MDIKLKATLLGALVVVAAGLGAHMGESAIAQINPLYFQGPAVHPRDRGAEVDEVMLPSQADRYADAYGWAQGNAARLADCGDCAALLARDAFAAPALHPAAVRHHFRDEPLPERMSVAPPPAEDEPEPVFVVENEDVARYAHYPIEEDPEGKAADEVVVEE